MDRIVVWVAAYLGVPLARYLPERALAWIAGAVGRSAYFLLPRRRKVALENLRRFYAGEKNEREIRGMARRSSAALAGAVIENLRFRRYLGGTADGMLPAQVRSEVCPSLQPAVALHQRTNGCIFVTLHAGAYTILPYLFATAGIPLTIAINPLRNGPLQGRWCPLDRERTPGSEIFVRKKNSSNALTEALERGRSVGFLADQRPGRGAGFDSSGMKVLTTPLPALLALRCGRPIMVGGCFRRFSGESYEIFLSEPLWPDRSAGSATETRRLAEAIDRELCALLRLHPERYLWMHNRWSPHRRRRASAPAALKR